ncbi:hypothetical protein F5B22DRAFT_124487 [Xylaria bambusicola]|uniref:uncharacterized protein n=1 Tax=Xylaria bambusicola TaxID=326684 RepID=UPI002008D428|nr:uncharacterized protein F5B22DRAFT_124487 [Xylaria bambusicola]KAI0517414.1 hypothetical protein F5B22DRAFT_124487 [Xylaria bambusicola]
MCSGCLAGNGKFIGGIVPLRADHQEVTGFACANHYYEGHGKHCSIRSRDPGMHVQASRVVRHIPIISFSTSGISYYLLAIGEDIHFIPPNPAKQQEIVKSIELFEDTLVGFIKQLGLDEEQFDSGPTRYRFSVHERSNGGQVGPPWYRAMYTMQHVLMMFVVNDYRIWGRRAKPYGRYALCLGLDELQKQMLAVEQVFKNPADT